MNNKTNTQDKMKEQNESIELQKALQESGFADRRTIRKAIHDEEITVNGHPCTDPHKLINPENDHVKYQGKKVQIKIQNRVYFIFHKPTEVLTALTDESSRKTLAEFISGIEERVYPVGRLDYHSEGLILLTNDGDLTNFMISPRNKINKSYQIKIKGKLDEAVKDKILARGFVVDAVRIKPQNLIFLKPTKSGNSWWQIDIFEGKKHVVRNLFKYLGHPVSKLKRIAIGPIKLKNLPSGHWRELTRDEVRLLKKEIGYTEQVR
jgi:23S rRNA pseudouridine2605 synthase